MQINVNFLDNLRLEAKFDDFTVITDQPIRYKGDGSAPSPFDYFLASSALCAAYFVRVYCKARDIPTDNIRLSQNRYNQIFKIQVAMSGDISDKDRQGILRSIDRCTVKKVVQTGPEFEIETVENLDEDAQALLMAGIDGEARTYIEGKDRPLEETIATMTGILEDLGMKIEIASWRNIVPHVWSLHIRDAASPMCFTNGKGATKESALCSALGEFIERLSCNFFYNDQYFGEEVANSAFVHYPNEQWFQPGPNDELPEEILDAHCRAIFDPERELGGSNLIDTNSGNEARGICSLPFERRSDGETVWFPSNLIENLYLSNGMSAGNTLPEAQVQCLSEIFERAVKKQIIEEELALPDVPKEVLAQYPNLVEGVEALEAQGFPVLVKDASLGGQFPVACVALMNPRTGGVFVSFGAHPSLAVALERSLTELLQGRSFENLNDVPLPTFNSLAVSEPNNFVEHFIDSTGVVSWRFFSDNADYDFHEWDFSGSTQQEAENLFGILEDLGKEVYMAVHEDLGAPVCRILVPGYSEVYPVEDLVSSNIVPIEMCFCELSCGLPTISTLLRIGVEFDENTVWGQLTVLELKLLINLAQGQHEEALERVEAFLQFNDNTVERNLFYRAVSAVLEIILDDELELDDYLRNLRRMYGDDTMDAVLGSVDGSVRFHGLTPTNTRLDGLEKHQRLIESYKKLHAARAARAGINLAG